MLYKTKISKEEINELESYQFKGKIHLITTAEEATKACVKLRQEEILGFDTETRPSFRKGEFHHVSLIQLATSKEAFLFRINFFTPPPELISLLSNPKILKVGVAIQEDMNALKKLIPFQEKNILDLALLAKKLKIENFGLRALTAITLEKRLSKQAKVTNWEKQELTPAQIHYAASDAVVSLLIYDKLQEFSLLHLNTRTTR